MTAPWKLTDTGFTLSAHPIGPPWVPVRVDTAPLDIRRADRAIESGQHPGDPVTAESIQVVVPKPSVPYAGVTCRNPARQNVKASISDSQTITSADAASAPRFHTPAGGPGRYRWGRSARAQVVADLAAVELDHVSGLVEDRDDGQAVEMLMARGAQHAQGLQAAPGHGALLALLVRQPVAERTVGVIPAGRRPTPRDGRHAGPGDTRAPRVTRSGCDGRNPPPNPAARNRPPTAAAAKAACAPRLDHR